MRQDNIEMFQDTMRILDQGLLYGRGPENQVKALPYRGERPEAIAV